MPIEAMKLDLIFRTGWTLEYINSLTMRDIHEYISILDARGKAGVR